MATWRIQRDVQQFFVLTRQREMPLCTNLFVLFHADVSVFAEAVSGDLNDPRAAAARGSPDRQRTSPRVH